MNQSICFRILNYITNYLYFALKNKHQIWFTSHEGMGIFVRYVISPFHPSFESKHLHYTMNSEFHTPAEWFMQIMYRTWMEGAHDKNKK